MGKRSSAGLCLYKDCRIKEYSLGVRSALLIISDAILFRHSLIRFLRKLPVPLSSIEGSSEFLYTTKATQSTRSRVPYKRNDKMAPTYHRGPPTAQEYLRLLKLQPIHESEQAAPVSALSYSSSSTFIHARNSLSSLQARQSPPRNSIHAPRGGYYYYTTGSGGDWSSGLSAGAIAGIVIGCIVGAAVLAGLLYCCWAICRGPPRRQHPVYYYERDILVGRDGRCRRRGRTRCRRREPCRERRGDCREPCRDRRYYYGYGDSYPYPYPFGYSKGYRCCHRWPCYEPRCDVSCRAGTGTKKGTIIVGKEKSRRGSECEEIVSVSRPATVKVTGVV
ncbi:hypothetical protein F5Y16DRAFT_310643 [Xylariaceae sp. FL0255]|nr:hypothetical protein F5Y16DRAFT_310643 [Xylariaceae sp. FL0255]